MPEELLLSGQITLSVFLAIATLRLFEKAVDKWNGKFGNGNGNGHKNGGYTSSDRALAEADRVERKAAVVRICDSLDRLERRLDDQTRRLVNKLDELQDTLRER